MEQNGFSYTSSEAKGQNSHHLLCTKFPEPLHNIEAKLAEKGYWEGELIHCTKDQRLIHVASRWRRFSNHDVSILETNFDLSQHKALEVARFWEEKAKLLGELSHQINNPLAAATNAAYMLRTGCNEPVRQYLDILQESINRIADFIRETNKLHHTARSEGDLLQQKIGGRLQ